MTPEFPHRVDVDVHSERDAASVCWYRGMTSSSREMPTRLFPARRLLYFRKSSLV